MEKRSEETKSESESAGSQSLEAARIETYCSRIDKALSWSEIWEIVKDTVREFLREYRSGMLLFLDDLPLRLGAYHPLGTNNIVLNRTLVDIVESTTESRRLVNAFVYSLLTHEYLHALGHISEAEVRSLVYEVSKACFGEDHVVTQLAAEGPWTLLLNVPLDRISKPRGVMEVVKNFEQPSQRYII